MMKWIIKRQLDAFEREYDYDSSYLREVLETGVGAMMAFHKATKLGEQRQGLTTGAWYAAKLVSIRTEDCGPCTQLVATMAERDGVPAEVIGAVLGGDFSGLPDDIALASRFTTAVLARDASLDALREQVIERFGKRGLVSLAYALLSARLYPPLKYALGYGKTCAPVELDGKRIWTPAPQAA